MPRSLLCVISVQLILKIEGRYSGISEVQPIKLQVKANMVQCRKSSDSKSIFT